MGQVALAVKPTVLAEQLVQVVKPTVLAEQAELLVQVVLAVKPTVLAELLVVLDCRGLLVLVAVLVPQDKTV